MNLLGFNPWLIGGVAAAFLAVASFAGCEHVRAKSAVADRAQMKAERDLERQNVKTVLDANTTNKATISTLHGALEGWKKLATPAASMREAAARAGQFENEVKRLSAELDRRAEKEDANPDCDALLETDFERLCPVAARGMRDRAGRYEDRSAGSPGPSGGEDKPIFDEGL